MKASEVAAKLLKTPNAEVLVRVESDWVECTGVTTTGQHRNAVCLKATNPELGGGVLVVPPDEETA